jgi:hypothetical protein
MTSRTTSAAELLRSRICRLVLQLKRLEQKRYRLALQLKHLEPPRLSRDEAGKIVQGQSWSPTGLAKWDLP